MKKLIILFTLILSIASVAQNLVPNPSFENIDMDCISDLDTTWSGGGNTLIECAEPWFQPASISSTDIHFSWFSYPFSSDLVRTGITSTRFSCFNDWVFENADVPDFDSPREYVEVELNETLEAGTTYVVTMYARAINCSGQTNGLGAYFSEDSILYNNQIFMQNAWDPSLCPLEAQVELNNDELITEEWFHFYRTFVANGTEKFMTIGNFIEDEKLNYWMNDVDDCIGYEMLPEVIYLDDIAVFPLGSFQDTANAGNDTTICIGEMVSMGSHNYPDYTYAWLDENGNEYAGAYLEFIPSLTSTFVLSVKDNFFIETYDTITVYVDDCIEYSANAGADTTICIGESLVLEDVYYSNYTYSWTDDFAGLWTGSSIEITPTLATNIYLQVTDDLAVTYDTLHVNVQDCDNAIDEAISKRIKIHPNPASTQIHIESPCAVSLWKVLDAVGKEVASSKYLVSSRNLVLDVSSFDAGLYFLEMEVNGIQVIKQLVIE